VRGMAVIGGLRPYARRFPFWLVALTLSAYIGSRFPDIDQHTELLTHRSILTHGLLVPLALYLTALRVKNSRVSASVLIFTTAIAIHLCFDLFPRAWFGYALVHVPSIGWVPPLASQAWLFASTVFCLYVTIKLMERGSHARLFLVGAGCIFIYQSFGEAKFFSPLITLFVASTVAFWWKLTPRSSKYAMLRKTISATFSATRGSAIFMAAGYKRLRYLIKP
jgi:hypothetical protein